MVYYPCLKGGIWMTLEEVVRRAMKKGKLSQTALAKRWGTSPQAINNKVRLYGWTTAELAEIASFAGGQVGIIYPDGEQLLIDPPAEEPEAEA